MNKKVLTLCAGALLMSMTVGTALAHQPEYRNAFVPSGFDATPETVNQIDTTKWYQLRVPLDHLEGQDAYGLLVQTRDKQTGKVYLRVIPQGGVPLLPSLWKIKYNAAGDGVSGGHWTFINKETNLELSYDHTFAARGNATATDDNAVIEACNTTWEWYNTNKQGSDFGFVAPYAYTDAKAAGEEVMCLRLTDGGLVYSYVGTHEEIIENNEVNLSLTPLRIQPVLAESIVLKPSDFNSMIDFNKQSQAQNGEFKFFYPNGNAMDSTRLTGFEAAAMLPGQMYHAAYDDISAIYNMALEQEGVTENVADKYKAVETAKDAWLGENGTNVALAQALNDYQYAIGARERVELALKNAEDELTAKSNNVATYLNTIKEQVTKVLGIYNSEDSYTYSNLTRSFAQLIDEKIILVKAGADIASLEETLKAAISDYEGKTNAADQTISAINVIDAASDYFSAYEVTSSTDINSKLKNIWSRSMYSVINDASTVAAGEEISNAIESYEQQQEYVEICETELEKKRSEVSSTLIIYNDAAQANDAAIQAVSDAKKALDDAIDNQHAYERTKYILDEGYMRLKLMEDDGVNVADNNNYLMVDTTFWESNTQTGIVPNAANLKVVNKTPDSREAAAIAARYFFKLTYFPSQDSIVVEPLNASAISNREYNAGTKWIDSYAGQWFVWENDAAHGSQPSNTFTRAADESGLPIVVKLHPDAATSGLALTTGSANREADTYLRTRIGFNNPYDYLNRITLDEGLYFIQSKNAGGKNVVANMSGFLMYDVPEVDAQDFNDMPATMFVVEKAGCDNGSRVTIHNREYGNWGRAFEGQLYEDKDGIYFINARDYNNSLGSYKLAIDDHYTITPVTDAEALTSDKHGYQFIEPETLPYTEYAIHYNLAANQNLYLNVADDNFVMGTEGAETYYQLDTINPINNQGTVLNSFGYGEGVANLPQLKRQAYVLKVRDVNLIDNDTTYVALVTEPGQNGYYKAMGINDIRNNKGQLAQFYLKADQLNDSTKYYALVDIRENTFRPEINNGVRMARYNDANGYISYDDLNNAPDERIAAFALVTNDRPLYRTIEDETVNFYNSSNQKLYEDAGFLGFTTSENGAMAVEAVVGSNVRMPQYLLGFNKDSVADGYWCNTNTHGYFASVEEAEAAAEDVTHIVRYNGYTTGRYLVNYTDSVLKYGEGSHAYHNPNDFTHRGLAVRLGFVEGVHMVVTADEAKNINDFLGTEVKAGEYFFTLVGGHTLADLKNEQGYIIPERLFSDKYTKMNAYTSGKHNNWSFSFRLTDLAGDGDQSEFLIESNLEGVSSIGSMEGAWVKDVNGCPVINYISGNHTTIEADDVEADNITDGDIFTLEATNETATANEEISANGEVSVVATDGAVIVKGAEGKNVIVSTILGKVVANEVLNSDNETIAAPAGIVVVSVDGESFKVAVK